MRRTGHVLALAGVILMATSAWNLAFAGGPGILGAGASFPQLEIEQWRADVARSPYSLNVNYVSAGSTFGREQYIGGNVDFAVSDIPFEIDELARLGSRRPFVYVPVSAGGVGFMYNLKDPSGSRITSLRLSQASVCRLFTERMFWDDPSIAADNPGLSLPHEKVVPVLRSDGAGTGYVFTDFCIATSPDVWSRFINLVKSDPVLYNGADQRFLSGGPTSRWPPFAGMTAFSSDGVANAVASEVTGNGAITYVEAGFALVRGFPVASVRNSAGAYTQPSASNVNRGLAYASSAPGGTLHLAYSAPAPDVYFPSSYSYAIVPTSSFDPAKGAVLGEFLDYAVTKGQDRAERLGYARLSKPIVDASLDNIARIPGAPPRPTSDGAAPPAPEVPPIQGPGGSEGAPLSKGTSPGSSASIPDAGSGAGPASAGPASARVLGEGTSRPGVTATAAGRPALGHHAPSAQPGAATGGDAVVSTPGGDEQDAPAQDDPALNGSVRSLGLSPGSLPHRPPTPGEAALTLAEGAGLCAFGMRLGSREGQ